MDVSSYSFWLTSAIRRVPPLTVDVQTSLGSVIIDAGVNRCTRNGAGSQVENKPHYGNENIDGEKSEWRNLPQN